MIRAIAIIGVLLLVGPAAAADTPAASVGRIVIPVSNLDSAVAFYAKALSFVPGQRFSSRRLELSLGSEVIELVERGGRPVPPGSRSNDGWFQHLAIVVSDIDLAYAKVLQSGGVAISAGPQRLPAWNPNAGGIRAVYFRDPDGHPLELIQFPPGRGAARWQETDRLFLGIDHTAIAASGTAQSLAFYRDRLGLRIAGASENWGIEQERLSAVRGAYVRITTLRAGAGPGIELLDYLTPRDGRPMPADTTPDDLWAEQIVLHGGTLSAGGERVRDPDGHLLRLVADRREASR